MCYILILKCIERIVNNIRYTESLRVFEILVELYKFFKWHPPEDLMVKNIKFIKFIFIKYIILIIIILG